MELSWQGWVALVCIAAPIYSYAGYPLVLLMIGSTAQLLRDLRHVVRKHERRARPGPLPSIAVVIAAYNEERFLAARIENLLALGYPPELLSIHIGSDGSTDRTNDILRRYQSERVCAHVFELNRGKASVLNDLVAAVDAPVVVFSDANTFFDAAALRHLAARFADPRIGAVSGELRLHGGKGGNQDGLYWRVEQVLKFMENRIGGLLGANGAIYAIRRSLWQRLAPDTICDDFCIAMNVAAAGWKVIYEPAAWASEEVPDAISEEYKRRVRIGIGNFQALVRHPEYLLRTSWGTRFAYVSHKVLRWLTPHLLVVALLLSAWQATASTPWAVFTILQCLAYAGAAGLYQFNRRGHRLPSMLAIAAFLFALNWAFLVASWRYATGQYRGAWGRTER